jgi:hypothetical protein
MEFIPMKKVKPCFLSRTAMSTFVFGFILTGCGGSESGKEVSDQTPETRNRQKPVQPDREKAAGASYSMRNNVPFEGVTN